MRYWLLLVALLGGCATAPHDNMTITRTITVLDPHCVDASNYVRTIVTLRDVGMSLQQIEDAAAVTKTASQPMMVYLRHEAYLGKFTDPEEARNFWLSACEQQGWKDFTGVIQNVQKVRLNTQLKMDME